jgi:hypothetical protein
MDEPRCNDTYGGHICYQAPSHGGLHRCGEPSDGNPCHASWPPIERRGLPSLYEWPQEAREAWVRWYQSVPPRVVAGAQKVED